MKINTSIKYKLYSTFTVLATLAAIVLISCANDFSDNSADESNKTASVNFSVNNQVSRNIFPEVKADMFTDITVTAIEKTDTEHTPRTWISGRTYEQLLTDVVKDIPISDYEITATAKIGVMTFTAYIPEQKIIQGINSIDLVFRLTDTGIADPEESGSFEIDINFAAEIKNAVKKVNYELTTVDGIPTGISGNLIPDSNGKVLCKKSVKTGTYIITFKFYGEDSIVGHLGVYSDYINIANDLPSKASIDIQQLNQVYTITYENLEREQLATGVVISEKCTRFGKIKLPVDSDISESVIKYLSGWYTTPDFAGEPITQLSNVSSDVVLYAKWVKRSLVDAKLKIKGELKTNAILTADYKMNDGVTTNDHVLNNVTFQWYRDDEPIPQANAPTYTITEEDSNRYIKLVITAKPDSEYEGSAQITCATAVRGIGNAAFDISLEAGNPFVLKIVDNKDENLHTIEVVGGNSNYTYKWYIDNKLQDTTTGIFDYSSLVSEDAEPGSYKITVEVKIEQESTVSASAIVTKLSSSREGT